MNLSETEVERREKKRQEEMKRELEKVKSRRIVRFNKYIHWYHLLINIHSRKEKKKEKPEKKKWYM